MKQQKQWIYGEGISICPPLMTNLFPVIVVSQLPVRSHLTTRRVFKEDYSIELTPKTAISREILPMMTEYTQETDQILYFPSTLKN